MHGEPSWAFLYRHMIPVLVDAGVRCIVPDLVGFGRSDKPTEQADYTYARHVEWMRQLLFDRLDLRGITFFGQDWGGLVGLRLVAAEPDRYRGVVVVNTGMPTGERPPTEAFLGWQNFAATTEDFPVGGIINGGCTTDLAARGDRRLRRPVPRRHLQGRRPAVPVAGADVDRRPAPRADNIAGLEGARGRSTCRSSHAFSDSDPITKGGEPGLRAAVPGAAGPAPHHHRGRRPLRAGGPGRPACAAVVARPHRARPDVTSAAASAGQVRIDRTADDVWAFIGDPARLHEWFPGIVDTKVDGTSRVITTGWGCRCPRRSSPTTPSPRRFQYRILLPVIKEHLSTLDVHDLGDGTCLAIYAADADPAAMALIIAGAAGNALENAKRHDGREPN